MSLDAAAPDVDRDVRRYTVEEHAQKVLPETGGSRTAGAAGVFRIAFAAICYGKLVSVYDWTEIRGKQIQEMVLQTKKRWTDAAALHAARIGRFCIAVAIGSLRRVQMGEQPAEKT